MIEKKIIHKDLTSDRWFSFSIAMQLANVGIDVERAFDWQKRENLEESNRAVDRALELLWFTIDDPKNKKRLRELLRVRALLADYFLGINEFEFTEQCWRNYFSYFIYAAAVEREQRKKIFPQSTSGNPAAG